MKQKFENLAYSMTSIYSLLELVKISNLLKESYSFRGQPKMFIIMLTLSFAMT